MAKSNGSPDKKKLVPAYGSYKTLVNFANDVREGGHIPLQVDRTLMSKISGSAASETIQALRFLGMVEGEKDIPTKAFEAFVMSSDDERAHALKTILFTAYDFLLAKPGFDIERASTQQVADLFREQGVSGTTVTRAISFFLAAAKDAGIKISHNVKAPKLPSSGLKQKKEKIAPPKNPEQTGKFEEIPEGTHRFEIPIPGKPSVQVLAPESLDASDWDMVAQMFAIYVNRWKGYTPPKKPAASVGAEGSS